MPELLKRKLGRTGADVTTLGYGAMELRFSPRGRLETPAQAEAILNSVLDAGINFIDTSIDYGESEELIGRYISHRRSEYFLASKCGCLVDPSKAPSGRPFQHIFTRENIVAGVHQSLRRMKTDHLDLVQFHASPSRETLIENDAIQTLLDLKDQGQIRFLGMSGTLPNLEEHIRMGVFDAFQIPYSAIRETTRRCWPGPQRRAPASSSAAASPEGTPRRAATGAIPGSSGRRPSWTTSWAA